MLRVLALVPYPTGRVPGQRYRIEQWAPHLARDGIEVTFAPFLSPRGLDVLYERGHVLTKLTETLRGYARRRRDLRNARGFDVAYVYREASPFGPAWLERRLARRIPFVFDFDDAIYLPAVSPANAWASRFKSPAKTADLCRLARHVIVGNETLAAYARPLAQAVTVVPSTIDTDVYVMRDRPPNPRPVIGWTGSQTTLPHLEALGPALRALRERVDFELRVIGGQPHVPGIDVHAIPWSAETEVEDLRELDVGLMPLPDDEWSRGKCGMKALQYMALGIPPVVSPVGVNATLVKDGVNGFHARNDAEWVDRLVVLVRNSALRHSLANEARRTMEQNYDARVVATRVAEVLNTAAPQDSGH